MFKKLFLSVLVLFFVVVAGGVYKVFNFLNTPPSDDDTEIVFEVKSAPFGVVAANLEKEELITDVLLFKALAKAQNQITSIKVGEFHLRRNMTPIEVLNTLVSGKMVQHSFTVQEGLNLYEVAEILSSKGLVNEMEFISLCKDPSFIKQVLGKELHSLEGYLFPDTYNVTKSDGAQKIIKTMVGKFKEVFNEIKSSSNKLRMEDHKVVVLASIIEKETGAPQERPMISSVFHNRLKKKMRLQSDPTIIYGIKETTGVWINNIKRKDIKAPTPYNTYTVRALPAGPISNPGKESLWAALNPVESQNLYFVSKNDGTHKFSKSLKDHNRAVRDFQLNSNARKGKSWRDLNKKRAQN